MLVQEKIERVKILGVVIGESGLGLDVIHHNSNSIKRLNHNSIITLLDVSDDYVVLLNLNNKVSNI